MRSIVVRTGKELLTKSTNTIGPAHRIINAAMSSSSSFTFEGEMQQQQQQQQQKNPPEPFYGSPRPKHSTVSSMSTIQSLSLAAYSATKAFMDPERHDMVATLSELTGHVALQNMYDSMMSSKTGQRILTERPIVSKATIDIQTLEQMDKNTFGYAYAMFLKKNGFDPDMRADVKYVSHEELRYVMLRYRQSHDYYHVITDLPPTVPGELALKYAELFQTGLPVCALSATVGSLKLGEEERRIWYDAYLPWAVKVGKEGKKWMNIYWEEEFDQDLEGLRKRIGVDIAPKV